MGVFNFTLKNDSEEEFDFDPYDSVLANVYIETIFHNIKDVLNFLINLKNNYNLVKKNLDYNYLKIKETRIEDFFIAKKERIDNYKNITINILKLQDYLKDIIDLEKSKNINKKLITVLEAYDYDINKIISICKSYRIH